MITLKFYWSWVDNFCVPFTCCWFKWWGHDVDVIHSLTYFFLLNFKHTEKMTLNQSYTLKLSSERNGMKRKNEIYGGICVVQGNSIPLFFVFFFILIQTFHQTFFLLSLFSLFFCFFFSKFIVVCTRTNKKKIDFSQDLCNTLFFSFGRNDFYFFLIFLVPQISLFSQQFCWFIFLSLKRKKGRYNSFSSLLNFFFFFY